MSLQDFRFALDLLKDKKVDEAREYLMGLEHPMAQRWLQNLDEASLDSTEALRRLEKRAALTQRRQSRTTRQPSIVTSTATVAQATTRNIEAMVHKEWVIGVVVAVAVAWIVMLVVLKLWWFVLSVLLITGVVTYLVASQETTKIDKQTGTVLRQYQFGQWIHYQVQASPPVPVIYEGESINHTYPGSIAAYSVMTANYDEKLAASLLIRATVISLWSQQAIDVHRVTLNRMLLNSELGDSDPVYYLLPNSDVDVKQVEGAVERHLFTKLAYWQRSNETALQTRPWRQGPTPYELTLDVMGNPRPAASRQIIGLVTRNAADKRLATSGGRAFEGLGFQFNSEVAPELKEQGQRLMRALTGADEREFLQALNSQVIAAVRRCTPDPGTSK